MKVPEIMERHFKIASPCSADWDQMVGDNRIRHCAECDLNVYNFSAMTTAEVEQIITTHEGRLCARMYRRADGTLLTEDCPVGFHAVLRQKFRHLSQFAGAALSAAMSVGFATGQSSSSQKPVSAPSSSLVQIDARGAAIKVAVKDPTGAVFPQANVVLVSDASHEQVAGTTDPSGELLLSKLAAGTYTLTVSAPGFHPVVEQVRLAKGHTEERALTLHIGAFMGEVVIVKPRTKLSSFFRKLGS